MCFRARNSGKANPYVVFVIAAVTSLAVLIFVAPEPSMDVTANSFHVETNNQVAKAKSTAQASAVAKHQREDKVRFESFQARVAQKQAALEAQAAEPQIEEMLVVAPRLTAPQFDFEDPELDISISAPAKPSLDNI